jgi:iron complex outermembrane receptor protein
VGYPIGQFYGLECKGLDANGNYIFVDQTGDGEISDPADYTYIGNAQPSLVYGINNSFKYKKLDFSFFLRGTLGNDLLNLPRLSYAQSGFLPGTNALDDPLTYQLNTTPRYSSFYIESGSFMRLDNISLGYTFNWLNGVRIYATAQNLLVITKYKGVDPELPIDLNDGLAPGIEDREFYPKARTFSIGFNVNL